MLNYVSIGQTSSGKTFTFLGPEDSLESCTLHALSSDHHHHHQHLPAAQTSTSINGDFSLQQTSSLLPSKAGVIVRVMDELLAAKRVFRKHQVQVAVKIQAVEIYEQSVTDLLSDGGRQAQVRRETGQIVHAQEEAIESFEQFLHTWHKVKLRQKFASTAMNERSSRAHTILIAHITQKRHDQSDSDQLVTSQLHLVDLAGSERVKKSKVVGQRMREAVGINSSLLVLGKVISGLVQVLFKTE